MTLSPGTRLGPYELTALLGAGGMGEVYRARDTRLSRDVAIKVLPEHLSSAEARQRFEREARAISHLSHAHICALYDVGEASVPWPGPQAEDSGGRSGAERHRSVQYLVMELLEGETLADRLSHGPLPIRQALDYGIQIADALARAHQRGIVHRDLKPANVMLTRSGVKLLDFGLARAVASAAPAALQSTPPTCEEPLTVAGSFLGTPPYMAPEQLEGREADARSDIFAFGATLYEMVTGRRAFAGATSVAVISAVMKEEPPPLSAIEPATPRALESLVHVCLSKDPDDRWQSARDIGLELRAISEAAASARPGTPARSFRTRLLPWAIAGLALAAAAAALPHALASGGEPARTIRFVLPPPAHTEFYYHAETSFLDVSPDGSRVAFIASDAQVSWEATSGNQRIFVRSLSSAEARPIPGTEGARSLCWSPDGRSIAFFAEDKLKRVEIAGGAPVTICDVPSRIGIAGTWGRNGDILFAGARGEAIYRVPAAGGTPGVLLRPDPSRGESGLYWPRFLPDSDRFLYLMRAADGRGTLMTASPGEAPHRVTEMESAAQYADPGYLVFAREATLLAQPFDARSGQVTGEAFPIADRVRYFLSTGVPCFATSRTGTLAYQPQDDSRRLVWFDRAGRRLGAIGQAGNYLDVSIASDGRSVLFDRTQPKTGTYDVWSLDVERGTETPITSDKDTEVFPVWLPGEKSVAYSIDRRKLPQLYRRDLITGREEKLLASTRFQMPQDVSPDGRLLVYLQRGNHGLFDVWALPLTGGNPFPVLQAPFEKEDVRFSPDGRYLAMITDESGRDEVYVMPFPGPGQRIRVSTDGAHLLRWSRDGRELIYLSADRRLMSVPVRTAPTLQIGTPAPLFRLTGPHDWIAFDVTPDGTRFLAVVPEVVAGDVPLSVVVNWTVGAGK